MSTNPRVPEPGALVRYKRASLASRSKHWLFNQARGVALGMLVLVPLHLFPPTIGAAFLAIACGIWYSTSRRTAAQLDSGDFDEYERKLIRTIEKRPATFRGEYAAISLGYITLRRGSVTEAMTIFQTAARTAKNHGFRRYAEVSAAACARLDGAERELDVELSPSPEPGTELLYCIITGRKGEIGRALSIQPRRSLMAKILMGRRRFLHERRLIDILHTSLRGDAGELSARRRARMTAAFPGEFDYVADRWPEVREVIDTLRLSVAKPSVARAKN